MVVVSSVTSVENCVPTKRCRMYPSQKLWINCEVRATLCALSSAFVSCNAEDYRKARYDLRRAKREYRLKLERFCFTADSRRMCQGQQHITAYQQGSKGVTTGTLPDERNAFYVRFEAVNNQREELLFLRGTNSQKASGPAPQSWLTPSSPPPLCPA